MCSDLELVSNSKVKVKTQCLTSGPMEMVTISMISTILPGSFNRCYVIGWKRCTIWVSVAGCFGGWVFRLEHIYPTNWQGSLRYYKKYAVFVLGTLQQRVGIRLISMSTDLVRYCVQSQIKVVTSNGSGVWGDRKNVEVCRKGR